MYHGWKIVSVAFTAHFFAVGLVMYSYGVLFKALAADFGGSRLGVATGLTVMQVAIALFAPLLGRALDRGSIRSIMMSGTLATAIGFLLASRMTALWQWYVLLATLLGLGTACLGNLSANTLVARWFGARRRGLALGIAAMGVSTSGAVMAPASTVLLTAFGWRGAFLSYAAILLLFMLPLLWLFVRTPEELGVTIEDEGSPTPSDVVTGAADGGEPGPEAGSTPMGMAPTVLRQRNFWAITLALGLNFGVNAALVTHIVPHGTDLGFEATEAALLVSLIGLLAALGKPAFGRLADRLDPRLAFTAAAGIQTAGLVLLSISESYPIVLVAAGLFGLGMGGLIPIWGAAVGAGFGRLAFGRVTGLTMIWMLPIQVVANPMTGYLFDRLGNYDAALWMMTSSVVASILVFSLLRLPRNEVAPN